MNIRKNALPICCYVCAFGAFGAFFRWLQNQIAVDHTTGVQNHSMWNVLVPLMLIAAAVVFYLIIRRRMDTHVFAMGMHDTFRATTPIHDSAALCIGVIIAAGGLITLIATRLDPQAGSYRFIGLMSILTGITFPAICTTQKRHLSPGLISVFSVIPLVLFLFWLIICYMHNASIPNVWSYCIEILACCSVAVALYFVAGYPFGVPKPFSCLYSCMLGAFMCLVTLADNRYFGLQLILFGTAAMLLMYAWMIISNMKTADDSAKKAAMAAEKAIAEEPEKEAVPTVPDDTVIPAGADMSMDEPTRQAEDAEP